MHFLDLSYKEGSTDRNRVKKQFNVDNLELARGYPHIPLKPLKRFQSILIRMNLGPKKPFVSTEEEVAWDQLKRSSDRRDIFWVLFHIDRIIHMRMEKTASTVIDW